MSNEEIVRRYFLLRKLCNFAPAYAWHKAVNSGKDKK